MSTFLLFSDDWLSSFLLISAPQQLLMMYLVYPPGCPITHILFFLFLLLLKFLAGLDPVTANCSAL
jgi:hypothetical protein